MPELPEFTFADITPEITPTPEEAVEEKVETTVEAPVETDVSDEAVSGEKPDIDITEEPLSEEEKAHYESLLNFYKDEGLAEFEKFEGKSKQEFADILRNQRIKERQQLEQSLISATPEYGQDIMEYMLTEGNLLTVEKLKSFLDIKQEAEIPEIESEEQARTYLQQLYTQQHDAETAEDLIEVLEDKGKLLEKSKELQAKQKAEAESKLKSKVEESKKAKEENLKVQKQFIHSLTKELKNTNWEGQIQSQVYSDIIQGGLREKTQAIVQYPKALIQLANYLRYFDTKTGKLDETAFLKNLGVETKAANKIKDSIDRHFSQSGAFSKGRSVNKEKNKNTQYTFAN